jgi:aminopeptidase N
MKNDMPELVLLKNYRPSAFLIDSVYLDVSLHATATRVVAKLKMRPNPKVPRAKGALVLDGEKLELLGLKLDGQELAASAFRVTETNLSLRSVPNKPFTLEITTRINPEANTALSGLYRSRGIYCTQCEAQGFRRITYFLDRPDVLATYTTRIEADRNEAAVLLGNGNPTERGVLDRGARHYAIWRDPHPKPSYLFALVGGNLISTTSSFRTMSGRRVDLGIYVEPGQENRCAWAMDCLKRSMAWDETRFGREYDLEVFNIVAVSDFNMGAMENKGLNIFNDRLVLATPETATDRNFADIERVIAHEYFHNWTGNRVTCRDWFQLCLKEGLTVYRDQEFSADTRSRAVQRIQDVRQLKARQFPEDAGPLAHPVRPDRYIEINNFYTATVYEKGAELCRMIATLIGLKAFRKGMDLYFERHDGDAATIEDFLACFAEVSGRNMDQFLTWYGQAGTPELVCNVKHDARARTADLTIEQVLAPTPGQPRKKPVLMPLRIGLMDSEGRDVPLQLASGAPIVDGVLELKQRRETFRFTNVATRPVPSLNRGFSAPVNLTISLSDKDLAFQMAHDSDPFNRWQATQDYGTRITIEAVKAIRAGRRPERPTAFMAALRDAVITKSLDPAFRAQLLSLPGESDIARIIGRDIDPAAIHKAVRGVARTMATTLGDDLEAIYESHEVRGTYEPSGSHAGKRALRNVALSLLSERGQSTDLARLQKHYSKARNATDEIAALAALSHQREALRVPAFEQYHKRWKGDHLMIDHWFAFQATSSLTSSLQTVKRLMRDPAFSMRNPNKVRALIFSFASANAVNFNRPDGKGYAFIADRILELDRINQQVAARLAGVFRNWAALETERRLQARRALQKVAATKNLSKDVTEVVGKILA